MDVNNRKVSLKDSKHHWERKVIFKRILWLLIQPFYLLVISKKLSFIRVLILRAFGAKIGKQCLIMPGVKVWFPWNLKLGDFVVIGSKVELYNFANISIGDNTVISQYSYLCTATHDYSKNDFPLIFYPIHIGEFCWVAAGVFVGPKVSLAQGAVIGAQSVVTKDVKNWEIWAGNPAVFIKTRHMKI